MFQPSKSEFETLAQRGNLVPVYRELPADLETPVSVYLKLRGQRSSFLLESVEGGEQIARYSFIGVNPSRIVSIRGNQVSVTSPTPSNGNGAPSAEPKQETDPMDAVRKL